MNKIKQCNLTSFALLWCSFQILQHLWRKNSNNNKLLLFSFYHHHVQEQQQQQHQQVTVGSFIYLRTFYNRKIKLQRFVIEHFSYFLASLSLTISHFKNISINQLLISLRKLLHFFALLKNIFQPDAIKVVFSPLTKATCPKEQLTLKNN